MTLAPCIRSQVVRQGQSTRHTLGLRRRTRRHIIRGVNNFYSDPEYYLSRWLTPALQAAATDHPVVVITGARQTGKSTLLLNADHFRKWRFLSLDDHARQL